MKPLEIHYYVYPTDKQAYKAHLWIDKNVRNKSEYHRQANVEKVEQDRLKRKAGLA